MPSPSASSIVSAGWPGVSSTRGPLIPEEMPDEQPKVSVSQELRQFISDFTTIVGPSTGETKWDGEVKTGGLFADFLKQQEEDEDGDDVRLGDELDEKYVIQEGDGPFTRMAKKFQQDLHRKNTLHGRSLNLFDVGNPFRRFLLGIIRTAYFEMFILLIVFAWCLSLAVKPVATDENPDPDVSVFNSINLALAVIFTLEMFARIIVHGVWQPKRAYFRSGANCLDFLVVVSMWMEFFAFGVQWGVSLAPLRVARIFVPIRLMRRAQGVRAILSALRRSLRPLGSVMVAMAFFFVAYAILMLDSYGNSMRRVCHTEVKTINLTVSNATANSSGVFTYTTEAIEVIAPGHGWETEGQNRFCSWDDKDLKSGPDNCPPGSRCVEKDESPEHNFNGFDHFGQALISLFELQSLDSWVMLFLQPLLDSEPKLHFVTWMNIGLCLFFVPILIVNLFVAVIVNTFMSIREETKTAIFSSKKLSKATLDRIAAQTFVIEDPDVDAEGGKSKKGKGKSADPDDEPAKIQFNVPDDEDEEDDDAWRDEEEDLFQGQLLTEDDMSLRAKLQRLVLKPNFEMFIVAVIVLNTIALAVEHEGQSDTVTDVLLVFEYIFTIFFLMELLIKMYALGPRLYFHSWSNCFDCLVVVLSLVQLFLESILPQLSSISVLRTFRVARILRVLHRVKNLWVLLQTVLNSLEAVFNMIFFMLLTGFAFAIIGKELFGGKMDDSRANFDTIGSAVFTLFLITTGDSWIESMISAMHGAERNADDPESIKTVQTVSAAVFYALFFVWSNYIILNLLIACMLENFEINQLDAPTEEIGLEERFAASPMPITALQQSELELGFKAKLKRRLKPARRIARRIAAAPMFEYVFVVITILSSLLMCLVGPPGREDIILSSGFVDAADIFFAILFFFEFLVKVFADAKWYFGNGWDRLDFVVLVISLGDIFSRDQLPNGARVLRAFRVIRALKVIGKNEDMKNVIASVLDSLPTLGYVTLLFLILTAIFAILGKGLFGGRFYRCNDPNFHYPSGKADCVGLFMSGPSETHGFPLPKSWRNDPANFDNAVLSFLTLFQCLMLTWQRIGYLAMDITGKETQPEENYSAGAVLFFMAFIFFARFFVANLFVTVVIEFYNRAQAGAVLTLKQRAWAHTLKNTIPHHFWKHYPRPQNRIRLFLFNRIRDKTVKRVAGVVLLLNVVLLCTIHSPQHENWTRAVKIVDSVFVVFYFFEFLSKIYAVGWPVWKFRAWFVFEGLLALFSTTLLIPEYALELENARIMGGVFRILRVMRLVNYSQSLTQLLQTCISAFLPVANVLLLNIIVNGIFAVIGVSLLGNVREGGYHRHEDFEDFFNSGITLFKVSMSDERGLMMIDCWVEAPRCTADVEVDGETVFGDCGTWVSAVYFPVHAVVTTFVMLNVLIAVIINHFRTYYQQLKDISVVKISDLESFGKKWRELDPKDTGLIRVDRIWDLLGEAKLPLRREVAPWMFGDLGRKKQGVRWAKSVRTELLLREYRTGRLQAALHALDSGVDPSETPFGKEEKERNRSIRSQLDAMDVPTRKISLKDKLLGNAHHVEEQDVMDVENDPLLKLYAAETLGNSTASPLLPMRKAAHFSRADKAAMRHEKLMKKRKQKLLYDLRQMERLIEGNPNSGGLVVSKKSVLLAALSWAVDPSFYPTERQERRALIMDVVRTHVTVLNFCAFFHTAIAKWHWTSNRPQKRRL